MPRSLALILFLASLLLLCPNSAHAAPTYTAKGCKAVSVSNVTSLQCTITGVLENEFIAIHIHSQGNRTFTVHDSFGLPWTLGKCENFSASSKAQGSKCWYYAYVGTHSGDDLITVSWSSAAGFDNIAAYDFCGMNPTPAELDDSQAAQITASGTFTDGFLTSTADLDLFLMFSQCDFCSTQTLGAGWTAMSPGFDDTGGITGYAVVSPAGTLTMETSGGAFSDIHDFVGLALKSNSSSGICGGPPPPPSLTGQFIRGVWWVNQSGGDTGGSGSGNFDNLNIDTGSPLPTGVVGQAYSTTLAASGGVKPYAWSEVNGSLPDGLAINANTAVISGTPTVATTDATSPSGYEDLMQWMILDSRRLSQHYSSGSWHYLFGDTVATSGAGPKFAWIKNGAGNPWDIDRYGGNSIDFWITENGDSSEDATCIANGYGGGCATDPNAYKRFVVPVPVAPRFFKLGTTVTLTSDAPNLIQRTTNCELDAEPTFDLGHIKGVTQGPTTIAWGGTVGTQPTVIVNYYWGGSGSTYSTREREFLVKNFGRVQWDTAHWTGSAYVVDATSTHNTLTAGASPDPNFPCGYSQIWWPGPDSALSTTIKVTDSASSFVQKTFALPIIDAPVQDLDISTSSPLPVATQGQSYSQTFTAIGGTSPYTFSLISGSLPPGITLSGATISGTPTASGTFSFTIQVTDNVSATASTAFSLTVNPVNVPKPPTVTTTSPLPNATEFSPYQVTLQASGGTPPYTWSHISGTLPAGLTLASDGVLSGTPTVTGIFNFTAQVTDSVSLTASKSFSLTVNLVVHSVELHWNASSGATSYNVYRSTVSGGCAVVTSSTCIKIGTGITQLQWTDANVQ